MPKGKNRQNKREQSGVQSKSLLSSAIPKIRVFLEILGVLMTLNFFYPKFSVSPSVSWNPSDPIQSSFIIKNDSNIICYAITSDFGSNITVNTGNAVLGAPVSVIHSLCPNESSTISIEEIIKTAPNSIESAEVYINLSSRPYFLPLPIFKKSYKFKARKTQCGYAWEPMFLDRVVK